MSTKNVKANAEKKSQDTKTETMSKVMLVKNLRSLVAGVAKVDADLALKIDKALKNKKTTVETLTTLLTEAVELGKKPVVANEEKPAKKNVGGITKSTKTGTTSDLKTKATTEKKSEKAKTKTTEKKSAPKANEKPTVATVQTTGNLKAPLATIFPKLITTKIDGEEVKLTLAKDNEFTTVEEIVEAMESKIVVLASYWTARHIKEFNYSAGFRVKAPKSFKDDLDLTIAVVDCPNAKRLWSMSLETEAMYFFEENELSPVEDTNPYNGEKYSVRVSNGMEFAIYTADAKQD